MNVFVVINILCIFCAECVYSMPAIVAQSSSSSMCQQSESYSASSANSYSSTSSSSSLSSCSPINIALYQDAFNLASINSAEAQLYLNYLSQLSGPQISAFDQLINMYSLNNYGMADYVTDFVAFQSEMSNIYNLLSAQSIYAANADWATQTSIYQQVQANLATALGYTTQGSCLYNLLNFANTDLTAIPLVAGSLYHLANLQNQYYSSSSSTRSAVSAPGISSTTTSSATTSTTASATTIDTTVYQNAFNLASINSAESQLYMNYLNQLSGPQISAFNQLINMYSLNNYGMADYVTDFVAFQSEMSNIYNLLSAQSIYAANADWATQTSIYQQVQANLATALGYTTQGSCLYNLLNYANTDLTAIPLVAGSLYHLANLQNQYYSSSSSTRSVVSAPGISSTTTSSATTSSTASSSAATIDTTVYQNAFNLASINSAESQLYMNYLSQLPGPQISAFDQLINMYSLNNYGMADYVTDFVAFQSEMSNIYNLLSAQSIYAANADWATQTSIYQQVQANLATALGYTTQGSCLYNLLNFANTDLTAIPLVAGSLYHLANLQNQFYSASSSSYQESSSYQASSSSSAMSQSVSQSSQSAVTVC